MMDESTANPLLITLLFIMRCMVPLLLMLGLSILLRRLGFISEPPSPENNNAKKDSIDESVNEGGLAHDGA